MTGRQIKISAMDGGEFDAYLAKPTAPSSGADPASGPGIIMLHEIFGVTDWIRETADLFADHGFCVVAPDMFWRMEPNFDGDHDSAEQTAQGRQFKADIDHEKAMDDLSAVIAALNTMPECNGKIGVTGFCTGGTMTYLAAARLKLDAAAAYYGTEIHKFLDEGKNISCPAIFHMGDKDDRVPENTPDLLREALTGVPHIAFHMYDAGHAFANTHRPDYLSQAAADAAHARTFELFDGLR